jgi:hypothetical protein
MDCDARSNGVAALVGIMVDRCLLRRVVARLNSQDVFLPRNAQRAVFVTKRKGVHLLDTDFTHETLAFFIKNGDLSFRPAALIAIATTRASEPHP